MTVAPLEIVILAAGKGSRMVSAMPKVLHEIGGKPLLAHVIDTALSLNPSNIHVVVGHGKQQVVGYFTAAGGRYEKLNWVEQTEQLGTGHAVQQVVPQIADDAVVLMLTADVPLISTATLQPMCDASAAFPLVLLTAIVPDPSGLGRILRDAADDVIGIVEQKDCSAEQQKIAEINSGIMCARASELKQWLQHLGNDNKQQEYYLTDIVEIAQRDGNPISALQPQGIFEVEGINTRVQLASVERRYQRMRAEQFMLQGVTIIDPARIDIRGDVSIGSDTIIDVNCVLIGPSKIASHVRIAPNCVISASTIGEHSQVHANTVLEETILGQHVNVGPFARLRPGTKLADQVRIGNFVETKNAQMAKGSKANHLSYVGDTTVGQNTNIGAGVITCNYDGAYKHQTVIGNDVFVGSDSQLIAPVEIEDGATIGAGSTITSKVHAGQLAISRAKQRQIDGWQRPKKTSSEKGN